MTRVCLSEVAEINPRGDRLAPDVEVSFVGMAELDAETAVGRPLALRPYSDVSKGYTPFRNGDLLAAKITPCWENGKVGIAELDTETGAGSTEFHVIRPSEQIDSRYLLHFLRRPEVRATGTLRMTGSGGQRRVPVRYLEELELDLPPLREQRRIAAILDKTASLRAASSRLREQLAEVSEAALERTASNACHHDALGNHLDFITSGGRGWSKYYSPAGQRFLQSLDVRMGEISNRDPVFVSPPENAEARRTRTLAGDVLLTITGSRIGRAAVVPPELEGAYISQHVAILRVSPGGDLHPEYLASWLAASRHGQRSIGSSQYGQTKPGLNFEQIRGFRLPIPSRSNQANLISVLKRTTRLRRMADAYDRLAAELTASLSAMAFHEDLRCS